jgi:hypothetical protein
MRMGGCEPCACGLGPVHRSWRLMFSSPDRKRLVIAFLVAPLAAPVAYVLGTLLIGFFKAGPALTARSTLDLLIGVFTLGAPSAYFAALGVGVPTYFVLRRLGVLTRWTMWLGGAALSVRCVHCHLDQGISLGVIWTCTNDVFYFPKRSKR